MNINEEIERNFHNDMKESERTFWRFLAPRYKECFVAFAYARDLEIQLSGIDTIIHLYSGLSYTCDEKFMGFPKPANPPHKRYAIELLSCSIPGHKKDGWFITGKADKWLFCYNTVDGLDCHLFDSAVLRNRFNILRKSGKKFSTFRMEWQPNRSSGLLLPFDDVEDICTRWVWPFPEDYTFPTLAAPKPPTV